MIGLICEVFAYRGLETASGRRVFDEMAGMIPFAAVPVGLRLVAIAVFVWWRSGDPNEPDRLLLHPRPAPLAARLLPVRRSFGAGAELVAVDSIDDPLGEVVLRILEDGFHPIQRSERK